MIAIGGAPRLGIFWTAIYLPDNEVIEVIHDNTKFSEINFCDRKLVRGPMIPYLNEQGDFVQIVSHSQESLSRNFNEILWPTFGAPSRVHPSQHLDAGNQGA